MPEALLAVRAVHFAASALATGVIVFAILVARPALAGTGEAGADIVARFATAAARLFCASLVVAVASGALWLVLVGADIADQSPSAALHDGTVWTLLTATRFGLVSQLRAIMAGLLLAVVLMFGSRPVFAGLNAASIVALVVSLCFIAALAFAGHGGATSGAEGYVHLGADILHLVAAAAWLGGLAPLVWLLGRLERDEQGTRVAVRVLQRFSSLGVVSVAVLAATGIVNSWFLVGSLYALTNTDYGTWLLLKIVLFVVMVSLAVVNRLILTRRLAPAKTDGTGIDQLRSIGSNALLEFLVGLAVIIVVGVLGTLAPAAHQFHVH